MTILTLALIAFVGTHLLMSHPLRAPMVKALGNGGQQIAYSLVSFATLGWAVWAFREAPLGSFLWMPGDAVRMLATVIMLIASVLLIGSFFGNPALSGGPVVPDRPQGVMAITRHPMMWSFALWSLAHILVSPRPPVIILSGFIALLALGGAAGQDIKKAKLMGERWHGWVSRTSFTPRFAGPGRKAIIGGTLLWLLATWAHPMLGAPAAGLWIWL